MKSVLDMPFWESKKERKNGEIIAALEYALAEMKKVKRQKLVQSATFTNVLGDSEVIIKITTK